MLSNIHTHTVFCDGKSTVEETVKSAIRKGFVSLGFSSHYFTDMYEPFGLANVEEYINEVITVKEKYKNDIQIYLGIEEDALQPISRERNKFDYIIGSNHFVFNKGKYLPIDYSSEMFDECIKLFDGNLLSFAESYYRTFCDYIFKFKPQIVGHFDLITKFDEQRENELLSNKEYNSVAEKYLMKALKSDSIFEINSGAVSRGYRTKPYPYENLLCLIYRENGKIILSSDAHDADTLDFGFDECKKLLKGIGFNYTYILYNNEFIKQEL